MASKTRSGKPASEDLCMIKKSILKDLQIQLGPLVEDRIKDHLDTVISEKIKDFLSAENFGTPISPISFESVKAMQSQVGNLESKQAKLLSELQELKESQAFISDQYDSLNTVIKNKSKEMDALKTENEKLKTEIKYNKDTINIYKIKVEELDAKSKKKVLEFHGVPASNGENTNAIILKTCDALGLKLDPSSISSSYRIPKTKQNVNTSTTALPQPIIVKFNTQTIKNNVYNLRKEIKKETKFPVPGQKRLFINENLTEERRKIFKEARRMKKENKITFLWTQNGKIYLRKTKESGKINITKISDLKLYN